MIFGGHFDAETKQKKLTELDNIMKKPDFWDDRKKAEEVIGQYNSIKENLDKAKKLKEEIEFIKEGLEETDDALELAEEEISKLKKEIEDLEIEVLLNGEYDKNNAILEIHSGADRTSKERIAAAKFAEKCKTEKDLQTHMSRLNKHSGLANTQEAKNIERLVRDINREYLE